MKPIAFALLLAASMLGSVAALAGPDDVKWMFTTERARAKLARAYPDTTKES